MSGQTSSSNGVVEPGNENESAWARSRSLKTVAPDEWVDAIVRVESQFDISDDSPIEQMGIVRGEKGYTRQFVTFDRLPWLEEGQTYFLESVVGDAYDGTLRIKLVSSCVEIHEQFYAIPDEPVDYHLVDFFGGADMYGRKLAVTLCAGPCGTN